MTKVMNLPDVTAVFAQCQTLSFTRDLVTGLRRCYPDLKFVIVDNGSQDESTEYLRSLGGREGFIIALNEDNWGHGLALDQALRLARTPLCLILDSDVEVWECGFLEPMIQRFNENPELYLLGSKARPSRGAEQKARFEKAKQLGKDNVNLFSSMIRREMYLSLPKFVHHGSPSLWNQNEARRRGFLLVDFPTEEYLHHIGSGTLRILGAFKQAGPVNPRTLEARIPRRRGIRQRGTILEKGPRRSTSAE